jgi:NAD(P)-dependent dehydrogenase (short-subunit alcohol dehydrogenase family)
MSSSGIPPRPSRSLVGKVAIVTGAGCADGGLGSGRAIAILLAEDGASVVCVDLDLALAEKTASLVSEEHAQKQHGGRGLAMQADVSSLEDCRAVVQRTKAELGRLDILVNNVGILGPRGTAVSTELADWAKGLEINVTSMMLMAKFAVPAMLENERGDGGIRGSIVNVGSTAGLLGGANGLLYTTSKGAVVQMTRAMAVDHGQDGIRVNTVCPGT